MNERTCTAEEGCDRTDLIVSLGLCRKHYKRLRKTGSTARRERPERTCTVCGVRAKTGDLCEAHAWRLRMYGDVQAEVPVRGRRAPSSEKPCSTCGITKPMDDFSFDNRRKDGRQARCRECVKAYQGQYRQADRERYLDLRRAERQRRRGKIRAYQLANKEHIQRWRRKWEAGLSAEKLEARRKKHRSWSAEYRRRNRDLCNERIRRWKKANPDKASEGYNRRRAWKYGNGTPEKFTRTEIGDRDGWTCGICGEPVDKTLRWPDLRSPSLDHAVPLSLGGEHSRANSRITHLICNIRRGTGQNITEASCPFPASSEDSRRIAPSRD